MVVACANSPCPKVRKMKMLSSSVAAAGAAAGGGLDDVESVHRSEQRGGDVEGHGGSEQREPDAAEGLPPARAVDPGGFEDVLVDGLEPGEVDEHGQAHPLPGVDEGDDDDRPGRAPEPGDGDVLTGDEAQDLR